MSPGSVQPEQGAGTAEIFPSVPSVQGERRVGDVSSQRREEHPEAPGVVTGIFSFGALRNSFLSMRNRIFHKPKRLSTAFFLPQLLNSPSQNRLGSS